MEIGTIIKKYRRERDMTQEQLAEYLRVSVSAVSQWESGKTAPDLSVIPAICNLFGISADELLGIDREHKQEKIDEILENASRYSDRGYMTEAEKVLESGLREYPDSYDLMHQLMHNKFGQGNYDEAIRLGTRILKECTDDSTREGARQILCYAYKSKGELDKALEIAQNLPCIHVTAELMYATLAKGIEGHRAHQSNIKTLLDLLDDELKRQVNDSNPAYSDEEKILINQKRLALYELIIEDGNYTFFHTRIFDIHFDLACRYAHKQDAKKTLYHLSVAADHAIAFVQEEGQGTYTCLLLRDYESSGFSTSISANDAARLQRDLASPAFDFIRDTPAFAAILARLEPVAGNWQVRE